MSPTLKLVVDGIVRGIVREKGVQRGALPVEVLRLPANQGGEVVIDPQAVGQGEGANCLFDFLNGAHGASLSEGAGLSSGSPCSCYRLRDRCYRCFAGSSGLPCSCCRLRDRCYSVYRDWETDRKSVV